MHASTAAKRLMIFAFINSINKACRGRIYTRDYIGLIKKREKKDRAGEAVGGNKDGGGDAGREQAAW